MSEYAEMMDKDPLNRFYLDPDAIEWARRPIERMVEKYRASYKQAHDMDSNRARFCRDLANALERELLGGDGCVIAAFDKRSPELRKKFRGEE